MLLNALGLLLEIIWAASFFYGIYCAVQAWNHLLPRRNRHHKLLDRLDRKGQQYFRKTLQAWGLAIGVIALTLLVF